ncbi:PH domain-containing protein [Rummeliibacillus pycnus]|uniref:PH domain-containing protein n=1 Tax=Rummeliibacillus pycnus TaxID=101070 RepID=UPI000C9A3715|nr:PH domain-containing protein [Rummeliibacillus pycnus]
MSRKINHLHPVTVAISFFSSLKNFVIPIAVILGGKGFHYSLNPNNPHFIGTLISGGCVLLVLCTILIMSIIKWRKFVYWFEKEELRIEHGVFVKKKRYIPFERIQSLNYKEGILHRPFKLVKVSIETAADNKGEAEADLIAITREQATMIEIEMKNAKQHEDHSKQINNFNQIEQKKKRSIIHQMSTKDLLILATTSSGIGVVFSGLAAIISQFDDWIPYEHIYGEFQNFIKFGVLMIGIVTLIVLMISWLLSVAITFVNNYGFVVEKEEDKLFVSKGLLEKKSITIPMKRIQGIRIVENPFRQFFGYATIVIESAGSSGEKDDKKIVMLPIVKKQQGLMVLKKLFPEMDWDFQLQRAPKKALFRYILKHVYWLIPIATLVTCFTFPYGLWLFLLLPFVVLLGVWQHRSAGYAIRNGQLTITYRGISQTTFVTVKKRIQSISLSQSYFAKRKNLATVSVHIMSGTFGSVAEIKHFDIVKMEEVFNWYEPNFR